MRWALQKRHGYDVRSLYCQQCLYLRVPSLVASSFHKIEVRNSSLELVVRLQLHWGRLEIALRWPFLVVIFMMQVCKCFCEMFRQSSDSYGGDHRGRQVLGLWSGSKREKRGNIVLLTAASIVFFLNFKQNLGQCSCVSHSFIGFPICIDSSYRP